MPTNTKPYTFLASIDVDAQQCFSPLCPDELPVPDGHKIVDELNNQARHAKLRIGSKDAHSPQALWVTNIKEQVANHLPAAVVEHNPNVDSYWPLHAVPGTKGFELLPGLPKPAEYDFFVWKGIELDMHPYGACYHDLQERMSTGLIEFLKAHQITHIVVGGLSLEFCVNTTVLQLAAAGFKVIVNLAATRYIYQDLTEKAIARMKEQAVTFITNSQELTTAIKKI